MKLKQMEEEFAITGVNQYKAHLEAQIEMLNVRVKEMQRRNHYAEIHEKRLSKEHTEKVLFIKHEEKDKGMSALRQLEFMKAKIDKINKGLRDNFERRKID